MRIDFDWDPAKAVSNAAKHGVTFEETMAVFGDPLARSILDQDSSPGEERWVTLGTWHDIDPDRVAVRIISARRATTKEARQYRDEPTA